MQMENEKIAAVLKSFIVALKPIKDEQDYKKASIQTIWWGLQRDLEDKVGKKRMTDIFNLCETHYKAKLKKAMSLGNGCVTHKMRISDEDLHIFYSKVDCNTPLGLQDKVHTY